MANQGIARELRNAYVNRILLRGLQVPLHRRRLVGDAAVAEADLRQHFAYRLEFRGVEHMGQETDHGRGRDADVAPMIGARRVRGNRSRRVNDARRTLLAFSNPSRER